MTGRSQTAHGDDDERNGGHGEYGDDRGADEAKLKGCQGLEPTAATRSASEHCARRELRTQQGR